MEDLVNVIISNHLLLSPSLMGPNFLLSSLFPDTPIYVLLSKRDIKVRHAYIKKRVK
jgi:hypothetical protein